MSLKDHTTGVTASKELDVTNLAERLTVEADYKNTVKQEIQKIQDSILPLRLRFNELLNLLATIDQKQDVSNQEIFTTIRLKVVEFFSEIQAFSGDYERLQPLFDVMEQLLKEDKSAPKFSPLERLRHLSDVGHSNQLRGAGGASPATATSAASGASANTKQTKSGTNTPTSNVPTPSAALNAAAKKSRKPRPKKNSIPTNLGAPTGLTPATAAATAAASTAMNSGANQQFTPSTNPAQIVSSMSPMNMMSSPMNIMSPVNSNNSMNFAASVKQPIQNQRHVPTNSQQVNMNSITPANILNMSMMEQANQATTAVPAHHKTQPDNNNLDLNNLDLSNLNMDFLQ